MVQQCCTYVEEITDLPVKLRLIDTLRMVTEGKVSFVLGDFFLLLVRVMCFYIACKYICMMILLVFLFLYDQIFSVVLANLRLSV